MFVPSMKVSLKYAVFPCTNLCLSLPGNMRIISFRNSSSIATAEVNFVFKIGIRVLSYLGVSSPAFFHSLAVFREDISENRQLQMLRS